MSGSRAKKLLWFAASAGLLIIAAGAAVVWSSSGDECWSASCEQAKSAARAEAAAAMALRSQQQRESAWRDIERAIRSEARLVEELSAAVEGHASAKASEDMSEVDRRETSYNSYKHIYSYNGTGMMEAFQIEEGFRKRRAAILTAKADAIELTVNPRESALRLLEMVQNVGAPKDSSALSKLADSESALQKSFGRLKAAIQSRGYMPADRLETYEKGFSDSHQSFTDALSRYRKTMTRPKAPAAPKS